jgi:pyruvate kinase
VAPVIGVCPDERTARVLMLNWGVIPMRLKPAEIADWQRMSRIVARRLKLSLAGRSVAVLSGFGKSGQKDQPVLKILRF